MDDARFDALTRRLASSTDRRSTLRGIAGGLLTAIGLGAGNAAAAPPAGKGPNKDQDGGGGPQGRCAPGFTNCRGTCVDLQGDRDNCGACATSCPDATVCFQGACVCPNGLTYANGGCYDVTSDPQNCGAVGSACAASTPYCLGGTCVACTADADCGSGYRCEGTVCVADAGLIIEVTAPDSTGYGTIYVEGFGLLPGTNLWSEADGSPTNPWSHVVDGNGNVHESKQYSCGMFTTVTMYGIAHDGTEVSATANAPC
jgi:hypothetical protein